MSTTIIDTVTNTGVVGIGTTVDSNLVPQVQTTVGMSSFLKKKTYISCTPELESYLEKLNWEDVDDDLVDESLIPFYFQIADNSQTAQVGFKRNLYTYSTATNPPTVDYNNFTNYQQPTFQYSYDNSTWNSYTLGNLITIGGNNNNIVYFRGDNLGPWCDKYTVETEETDEGNTVTRSTDFIVYTNAIINNATVKSGGNIMSLRYKNFINQLTIPCSCAFTGLFLECTNLIRPPKLPATTLADHCYSSMFFNSKIAIAPTLPAMTMQPYCYASMFSGCPFTEAPNLPATTLAEYCYGPDSFAFEYIYIGNTKGMFSFCSKLREIPSVLPATNLAPYCYYYMFYGCRDLEMVPILPATTLTEHCYAAMFHSCYGLTNCPALPATTLAAYCYDTMFGSCIQLRTSPVLPATTMANYCYSGMFSYCTSLETPPILPATTLADGCYEGMFSYTGLTTTPALRATTLTSNCYGGWFAVGMFQGCKSLTSITKLPALTIGSTNAYYSMFAGSNVKASATATSECSYAYRIPTSGTGSADSKSLTDMFVDASNTSNNFTPTVNTTFYINVPSF